MTPSPLNLRSMNLSDLLDRGISIYRQNFLSMLGIIAIVNLPLMLIEIIVVAFALPPDAFSLGRNIFNSGTGDGPASLLATGVTIVTGIVRLLAAAFETAALATLISEFFLGRRISFLQAYRVSLRRGFPILGASILQGIVVGGLIAIVLVPFFAFVIIGPSLGTSSSTSALALLVLGISCLALLPALGLTTFLSTRWIFTNQAITLDRFGVLGGLGRSWRLVRGSFWRVLGINFLLGILISVIQTVPVYAIQMTIFFIPSAALVTVANSVVQTAILTLVTPLQLAVLTLLYYDLRIRKEGFDLEVMAKQLEAHTLPPEGDW